MAALKVKTSQSVLGTVYTVKAGRDAYRVSILMGYGQPLILMGANIIPIDNPTRFGTWSTPAECRAYIRAFVAEWDTHQAVWDAIPCPD